MFFRNLLSGVLDPDKLDYLNRDAYFCGVPYGLQDIDFIISSILPHEKTGIAVIESGLPAVENILFSKYLMYRAVYWHKTVRSATSMVKKALFLGMKEGRIKPEELYGLDDETLFMNYRNSSYAPFTLLKKVSEREIFKTVIEIPFDLENSAHHCLTFLDKRLLKENEILSLLRKSYYPSADEESVIIDIPEQISFEVSLPVVSENRTLDFTASGSVFNKPVIKGFTGVLRKIRVFMPEEAAASVAEVQARRRISEIISSGC
jgi:HD superfamily phosphohydrolase